MIVTPARRKPLTEPQLVVRLRIVWVLFVLCVIALIATIPRCVGDAMQMNAYRNDPSCGRSASEGTKGACTTVEAKIADSNIENVETRHGEEAHYHLTVALPNGDQPDLEVPEQLYDAQVVSGKNVTAQLFEGSVARLTIGDTTDETDESPGGRLGSDGVGPLLAVLGILAFGFFILNGRLVLQKLRASRGG